MRTEGDAGFGFAQPPTPLKTDRRASQPRKSHHPAERDPGSQGLRHDLLSLLFILLMKDFIFLNIFS